MYFRTGEETVRYNQYQVNSLDKHKFWLKGRKRNRSYPSDN